jgi:hypothetical protein
MLLWLVLQELEVLAEFVVFEGVHQTVDYDTVRWIEEERSFFAEVEEVRV